MADENEEDLPPSLLAVEQTLLTEMGQLQREIAQEIAAENRRELTVRDKIDICMISIALLLTALLIWAKLNNYVPMTGPVPIAGVVLRRVFMRGH
jgi:hypothetical protein